MILFRDKFKIPFGYPAAEEGKGINSLILFAAARYYSAKTSKLISTWMSL